MRTLEPHCVCHIQLAVQWNPLPTRIPCRVSERILPEHVSLHLQPAAGTPWTHAQFGMEQGGLAQQSGIEDADVVDRFQT